MVSEVGVECAHVIADDSVCGDRFEGATFRSDEARCEVDYVCSDLRACVGEFAVAGNTLESVSVVE